MVDFNTILPVGALGTSTEGVRKINRNPFSQGVVTGGPVAQNIQGSNLYGVNENLGIGSEIGGQTQAGYKLGGRTLCFA